MQMIYKEARSRHALNPTHDPRRQLQLLVSEPLIRAGLARDDNDTRLRSLTVSLRCCPLQNVDVANLCRIENAGQLRRNLSSVQYEERGGRRRSIIGPFRHDLYDLACAGTIPFSRGGPNQVTNGYDVSWVDLVDISPPNHASIKN